MQRGITTKLKLFAIMLTPAAGGAATVLVAAVKVQPALAGDSDSGDGTGGGSGATSHKSHLKNNGRK